MRWKLLVIAAVTAFAGCQSGPHLPECATLTSVSLSGADGGLTSPNQVDIDFGGIPFGQTGTANIQLHFSDAAQLDYSLASPGLDLEFGLQTGASFITDAGAEDMVVFFQPYKTGAVASSFTVDFHEPEGCADTPPALTVNLTGVGLTTCVFVQPDLLDFGATLVGTSVTKSVTLTTCAGQVDGLLAQVSGSDAKLFTLGKLPASLPPFSTTELQITYSPTSLETRSLANVVFSGPDGEQSKLNLFGEPTDLDDGGLPCQPGNSTYCCLDTLAPALVGTSDSSGCRTCIADAGGAYWSDWPLGSSCAGPANGDAGVCFDAEGTDGSDNSCVCNSSYPGYPAPCSVTGLTDEDAGVFPCCSGVCIALDAGASLGACACAPGYDGGSCP